MSDFETLIRQSLKERKSKSFHAVNDLNSIMTELAVAVANVTNGKLKLFLEPLKPKPNSGPTSAVVLRFPNEDTALRVIAFGTVGYPATIWATDQDWDEDTEKWFKVESSNTLRGHLQKMVSGPQSELIALIANELAVAEADTGAALAS